VATTLHNATAAPTHTGEGLLVRAVKSRKYRSSGELPRQEAHRPKKTSRFEVEVPLIAAAAEIAAVLHARSNGSTVSVFHGNLLGRPRFAVSTYPERSVEIVGLPTRDLLFAFAVLNADVLLRRDHALGTWFDCKRKRHVLDVVVCPASREAAFRLGRNGNQRAIFDLERSKEIWLIPTSNVRLDEFPGEER